MSMSVPALRSLSSQAVSPAFVERKSYSCGFVRPPPARPCPARTPVSARRSAADAAPPRGDYAAAWLDLLAPDSYSYRPAPPSLPGTIAPPRSGGVAIATPGRAGLLAFGGYAEAASAAGPERRAAHDLWTFVPYRAPATADGASAWGWTPVPPGAGAYVPGPRLAAALAVLPAPPSASSEDRGDDVARPRAVLFGGWDPQTPGTGGIILEDVSMLDLESLEWSQLTTTKKNTAGSSPEECVVNIPGGPTSRHVAVSLSLKQSGSDRVRHVICLHNHRCDDHVLLFSTDGTSDEGARDASPGVHWERQPVTGDVPSSRGLHCAAPLTRGDDGGGGTATAVVTFGGAARDGRMSNEVHALDVATWGWTALDCGDGALPGPRAGACLCPLADNSVVLFGGAMPGEDGGLVGLNDVWVLHVDMERGKGEWTCLLSNSSTVGDACPPGRNAATLSRIDAEKLLPKELLSRDGENCAYFLLQGGWNPFRETYNDVFVLCITPAN